jgi:hypothetical protein
VILVDVCLDIGQMASGGLEIEDSHCLGLGSTIVIHESGIGANLGSAS